MDDVVVDVGADVEVDCRAWEKGHGACRCPSTPFITASVDSSCTPCRTPRYLLRQDKVQSHNPKRERESVAVWVQRGKHTHTHTFNVCKGNGLEKQH